MALTFGGGHGTWLQLYLTNLPWGAWLGVATTTGALLLALRERSPARGALLAAVGGPVTAFALTTGLSLLRTEDPGWLIDVWLWQWQLPGVVPFLGVGVLDGLYAYGARVAIRRRHGLGLQSSVTAASLLLLAALAALFIGLTEKWLSPYELLRTGAVMWNKGWRGMRITAGLVALLSGGSGALITASVRRAQR